MAIIIREDIRMLHNHFRIVCIISTKLLKFAYKFLTANQQGFSSSYFPQGGMIPPAQMGMSQPIIPPMPVPNGPGAQQGQTFDPAAVPPAPVTMPEPPQNGPVIPNAPVIPPNPQMMQQQQQQPQSQQQMPLTQPQGPVIPQGMSGIPPAQEQFRPAIYGPPAGQLQMFNSNPLPSPPKDLYEMSPYRSLLRDLPTTTSLLNGMQSDHRRTHSVGAGGGGGGGGLGSLLGSRSKNSRKGIFGSSRDDGPGYSAGLSRSNTTASFIIAPQVPQPPSAPPIPAPAPSDPDRPAPVRFDHNSPLAGFMNHSPHRILHQEKIYPTALHLLEALKFVGHRPDLSERIRAVKDVHDVYPLSATMHELVRPDWGQVFLQMVEEVLYLKFRQHPDLRSLLMNTGLADIIYSEEGDNYWGEGPLGQGANELGKAIVRARERLRREGYSVGPPP